MSAVGISRAALDEPLGALFARAAGRWPERLAVKGRARALTYSELDRASNRLARAILARCGPGSGRLALLFSHDALVVVAILAALKAGKCYVPLDPHHPPARTAGILADCQPGLLVYDHAHGDRARALAGAGVDLLDAEAIGDEWSAEAPAVDVSSHALAAICYSSGSTGDPKGIVWDHRGITHRAVVQIALAQLAPEDRVALFQSVAVGAAFRRIFGALLGGAALLPFDVRTEPADALTAWLAAEQITMCAFAASVFRHFAGRLSGAERFPALRQISIQSEAVLWSDVALFRARFAPPCELVTGLSTSEAGIISSFRVHDGVVPEGPAVPVGYAVPDKQVLVIDDAGRPVERGEEGEIAVRSEFLAVGYWRRPEIDDRVFAPDPDGGPARICRTGDLGRMRPDGCLVHLGRKDTRAKLRGRFVDTREIEAALLDHPALDGAAVSVREDRPGDQRLVAHVVARPGQAPAVGELQRSVRDRLGDHLTPSAFVFLTALPRTPNGKVDRRALPAPGRARPPLATPYAAPRTPVERAVARVWAEALRLDEVGIHDDFLELGGTSLVAGRVASGVIAQLRVDVAARALLDAPSVADMAAVVVEHLLTAMPPETGATLLSELEADRATRRSPEAALPDHEG